MKINTLFRTAISAFTFFVMMQGAFAVGVTPVRNELNIDPGSSADAHITIINNNDADYYVEPKIAVFLRNDERGYPIHEEFEESDIHNIRKWISIPDENILVPANDRATVDFTVSVPIGAEPGGKYATIGFVPVKDDSGAVTIKVQANSILLINVNGEVIIDGDVIDFGIPESIFSDKGFNLETNFENTGNTHVKPSGSITLKNKQTNEFLKKIGIFYDEKTDSQSIGDAITVNINEGNVLPNSNRIFNTEWTDNIQEGEYTAYLTLKYKEDMQVIEKEFDFELIEDLTIDSFELKTQNLKSDFVLTVTNTGNIYEKLVGIIEITNTFGYKVDEIVIPEDIRYIQPNSTETFTFKWIEQDIPRGGYKATLKAKHGVSNSDITAKVSFGVSYIKIISAIGLGLVLLLIIVVFIRKRKKKPVVEI